MIRAANATDILSAIAASVGAVRPDLSSLIKPALRRAAHILAPSSRSDLVSFVTEPLAAFGDVKEAVEAALEELIVYGDILEMRRQESDAWGAPETVLRPAPPSFVRRSNGDIIILGVSGDDPTPLSGAMHDGMIDNGMVRYLPRQGKETPNVLRLLGLTELSEPAWLRTPQLQTASSFVATWRQRLLDGKSTSHVTDGLTLVAMNGRPEFYAGRRQPAGSATGIFVGRRPQLYGAALWCLVALESGRTTRLLDLYADDDKQRPCDIAWRILAALDSEAGAPQQVRVRSAGDNAALELFSPLPAFAERRLAVAGVKCEGKGCLFSYVVPQSAVSRELEALKVTLWLTADETRQ